MSDIDPRELHYDARASIYFCDELNLAINKVDPSPTEIVRAMRIQPERNATIGISNFLAVRSFLVEERASLTALYNFLDKANEITEAIPLTENHLESLSVRFKDMFGDSEEEAFTKLDNDDFFRSVMREPNEQLPGLAKYIAGFKLSSLKTPEQAYTDSGKVKADIEAELWSGMKDFQDRTYGRLSLRDWGMTSDGGPVSSLRESIEVCSDSIDSKLVGQVIDSYYFE